MKIKTLSRSSDTYIPASSAELQRHPRNLDPALHPFEKAREYTRALNATKLERVFAKPFVGQLGNGHIDGVYCIARDPKNLATVASGSGDGEIKVWDLATRQETFTVKAHENIVRGLTVTPNGQVLSCASDKNIKLWDVFSGSQNKEALQTYLAPQGLNAIDHHRSDSTFATASSLVEIWDTNRTKPISQLKWGTEAVNAVRFNQTETSILASAGSDRSIVVYDLRTNSPVQKLVSSMATNAICWNPMEAFNFAAANEDHNVYLYDMRRMDRAVNIYKDHVAAVMDVDFSPTGQELVTGSYDRTIRLFKVKEGHSRDIYHTKRMQRLFCVKYTADSRFVLSGSDDGNVRVWRSNASERAGIKTVRERSKLEYDQALKDRYKHMPEIRRISRHRHLPTAVKKAKDIKRVELESLKRKQENEWRHGKQDRDATHDKAKHIVGTAIKRS